MYLNKSAQDKFLEGGYGRKHHQDALELCLFYSTKPDDKYKISDELMRTSITPVKRHHMPANIPDVCPKCLDEKGTLFNWPWRRPEKQQFLEGCLS